MAEFRPVAGWNNYLASSDGYVINAKTGMRLVGCVKNAGYLSIMLSNNGAHKHISLHRIIAETFCEKPEGANEVNHINGDKLDNRAENLEWVTHGDNLKHAYETGLMPNDATPKAVTATNIETGEQMEFPSIYKAARFFNISQGNICMCCKGFRPYAGGYYWEYQEEEK